MTTNSEIYINGSRENYLKLQVIPHVNKEYIHGGPRYLDIILTHCGKEIGAKREFYERGALVSQYYTITEYGLDLLKEKYDSQIT